MTDVVLDASAILAVILDEPGAEQVEPYVPGGTASAVNLGEVVAKLRDLGMVEARVDEIIASLQLDVRAHDLPAAQAAGHLRPVTRSAELSLAAFASDHSRSRLARGGRCRRRAGRPDSLKPPRQRNTMPQ